MKKKKFYNICARTVDNIDQVKIFKDALESSLTVGNNKLERSSMEICMFVQSLASSKIF